MMEQILGSVVSEQGASVLLPSPEPALFLPGERAPSSSPGPLQAGTEPG